MKEGKFKLTQKDTGAKSKAKEIIKGTYWQCLGKYHQLCSFSYLNHKMFSDIHYEIKNIKR